MSWIHSPTSSSQKGDLHLAVRDDNDPECWQVQVKISIALCLAFVEYAIMHHACNLNRAMIMSGLSIY